MFFALYRSDRNGQLIFENFYCKYSEHLPSLLRGLTNYFMKLNLIWGGGRIILSGLTNGVCLIFCLFCVLSIFVRYLKTKTFVMPSSKSSQKLVFSMLEAGICYKCSKKHQRLCCMYVSKEKLGIFCLKVSYVLGKVCWLSVTYQFRPRYGS